MHHQERFRKIHRRSRGLGLMEVVISLGVLSIVLLATMTLFQHQLKMNKTSDTSAQYIAFKDQIMAVLRTKAICDAVFTAMTSSFVDNPTVQSDISIQLPDGQVIAPGQMHGSLQIKTVQLRNITPISASPTLRAGTLYLELTRVGEVYGGSQLAPFDPTFFFSINGTPTITSCEDYTLDAQTLCTSMGGTWDTTATPNCKLNLPSCPAGQIFTGYSGINPVCTDLISIFPTCATDQFLVFNGTTYVCRDLSSIIGGLCPAGTVPVSTGAGVICQSHTPSATYSWNAGSWGSCASGSQTRAVSCHDDATGSTVADSSCTTTKPATSQTCTTFSWNIGSWGTCTSGSQSRSVTCRNDSTGSTVADASCTTTKPAISQTCSVPGPCTPDFHGQVAASCCPAPPPGYTPRACCVVDSTGPIPPTWRTTFSPGPGQTAFFCGCSNSPVWFVGAVSGC